MKSKFLFTFLACILMSYSLVSGQSITLDHTTGLTALGNLRTDTTVTFFIRMTNEPVKYTGISNGFSITSPQGANWTTAAGGEVAPMSSFFTVFSIANNNITGVDADTVGFGGIDFGSGAALAASFDDVAYSITIGPISVSEEGKTIVLDSAFYAPTGAWKWAKNGGDQFPTWGGPYEFKIGDVAVNAPPVLDPIGAKSTDEGVNLNFAVTASDPDGPAPTLSATNLPTGATFVGGTFNWTPTFDQADSYDVTFTADDGTDTDNEIVTITVNNTNRAPVLDSIGSKSVDENMNLNFVVTSSDPDGGNGGISATGLPDGATYVGGISGTFDWTPTFDQAGSYDVTFSTNDGLLSDSETITITVNNVNRAPVLATIGNKSVDEGVEITFDISATDPDGTVIILFNVDPLPEGASFVINTDGSATFTWTPLFTQSNDYILTFTTSDGELFDEETITITVNDVNQPPVLVEIGPQAVTAGDSLIFTALSFDPDGTVPTLTSSALPGDASFAVPPGDGAGLFFWATTVADSGVYEVTFSTTDGEFTDSELVVITVGEAPKILVATPDSLSFSFVDGDVSPDFADVNLSELNGAVIIAEATESASWMSISGLSPSTNLPAILAVEINPIGLAIGSFQDSIIITSASTVNTEVVYVSVTITERPNTPAFITSFEGTQFETDECTPIDIFIGTDDAEGDPVSISMNGLVENMIFLDNGNGTADFNFTPNFAQAGVYPVDIVLFDGRDTSLFPIEIFVLECEPGTAGDTVSVATVPAVPGARITVPINFANLCDLGEFDISVGWTSSVITLDSLSFIDSRIGSFVISDQINADSQFIRLSGIPFEIGGAQSPGSGNLVNLHFSLEVGAPAGFYPLDFYMEPMYLRDCGGGAESVRPFFIPGGIVVDTSGNYVCGYVVDPEGNAIAGATVELWDMFPTGSLQDMQDASGNGVFAFEDFTTIPFDLHAYHAGYYPGTVSDINFAQSGIMIVLTPIPDVDTPTNTWVDFFCGVNSFKESPISVGSVIEAYDPDGVKCGEFVVHTAGEYGFMHVYGDDEFTEADEGAMAGDDIRFYINGIEAIATGNAVWTEDRAVNEVCLDVPDITSHVCNLVAGWNLISWNVDSEVDDIANVLSSIDECVELVMGFEQGALTYDASLPQFSDLWSVDHLSAYWVKVSCDVELTVLGTPVPSTTPIPVTAGWNLVSYLPANSMPTEVALTTIHNDLVVALGFENNSGLTYLPGQNEFNDLTDMSSCFGYWVKVNNDGILIYPDGGADSEAGKGMYTQTSSSAGRIDATTSWMNIYAYDLKVDDVQVKSGAEIKAFNSDDVLVGSYVMRESGKFGFMPIYGDDKQTESIDGMKSGDKFYLTIDDVETTEKFTWTTSGDKLEIKSLSAKIVDGVLPTSYGLAQNYPNPFNPSTTINFDMPASSQVKIEIFNLLGQLIATPFDEVAGAGQHAVMWDGRNDGGKTVSSGIYFYRLTADNFTDTKKMTLLK